MGVKGCTFRSCKYCQEEDNGPTSRSYTYSEIFYKTGYAFRVNRHPGGMTTKRLIGGGVYMEMVYLCGARFFVSFYHKVS